MRWSNYCVHCCEKEMASWSLSVILSMEYSLDSVYKENWKVLKAFKYCTVKPQVYALTNHVNQRLW